MNWDMQRLVIPDMTSAAVIGEHVLVYQVVEFPDRTDSADGLEYDPEWLAILKSTNGLQRTTPQPWNPPMNNGLHQR